MLWIALWLPALPLDVFARGMPADAATPFAVTSGGHRPLIVAANAIACESGVAAGQLVSAALALSPGLAMRDRDVRAESKALGDLAAFLLGFTPLAALAKPDAVVAEVAASLNLFGGLARLVRHIDEGSAARGYRARYGIAPTPLAALALARAGRSTPVLNRCELPSLLASLPLAHFDVADDTIALLAAAGITTFGETAALPRDALARRCGPALPALCDRALGLAADARVAHVPAPRFASRLALPVPVHDSTALGFAVNRVVHDLVAWLLARGLGVSRVGLALRHERHQHRRIGARATTLAIALSTPTRSATHLTTVLRERLERTTLPAPVEAIVLASVDTAPLVGHSLGLLPGNHRDEIVVPLVDRLRARLGDDCIVGVAPRAEHRPEAALGQYAASSEATPKPRVDTPARPPRVRLRHGTQRLPDPDARAAEAMRQQPASARPLWLLHEPAPLAAAFAQAPWILHDGPERIESGWWDGNDVRRDYFVAETPQGGIAWVYRDHRRGTDDGEWFLHGWFA